MMAKQCVERYDHCRFYHSLILRSGCLVAVVRNRLLECYLSSDMNTTAFKPYIMLLYQTRLQHLTIFKVSNAFEQYSGTLLKDVNVK